MKYTLFQGDCLDFLATLEAESVDSIVTDCPAGIAFMGKDWDKDKGGRDKWIEWMTTVAAECLRVSKPGGYALVWALPRTSHWTATAWENAGFEVRDRIAHAFGQGYPKSMDISKNIDKQQYNRWINVSKAIDNLDIFSIINLWKNYSKNVKSAGISFQKNTIETGINMEKNGIVQEHVAVSLLQKKSNANVIIAELNLCEAHLMQSEIREVTALMLAGENKKQDLVKSVESKQQNDQARLCLTGIAQCNVRDLLNEKAEQIIKDAEALTTWLGRTKLSNEQDTNVLCVEITKVLKLIILNNSKTFQNLDTTSQMECVSAINVTITEYMAECLISFMAGIVKNKAIDNADGAVRKIIGEKNYSAPDIRGNSSNGRGIGGSENEGKERIAVNVTVPATDAAKEWQGFGTSLKPAIEDWWVFRKPLAEDTVVENVLRYGTGALNIDGCRVEGEPVTINRLEEWSGFGQKKNPDYESETNTAGRWPANFVHDGSEEVTRLFPVTERPSGIASGPTRGKMGTRGTYGSANGDMGESKFYGDTGSAARFFKCCPMDDPEDEQAQSLIYCAKASQADRNEGCDGLEEKIGKRTQDGGDDTRGRPIPVNRNHHPTVKATSLMRWLCRLVTRPGGVVLDPFTGSGSTGKGAILEGFDFMGSEKDPDYFQIAKARIEFACGNQSQSTVTGTAEPAAILAAQRSQKPGLMQQPGLF